MSGYVARIYTSADSFPPGLATHNFFHSPQFFALCKSTPRLRPYLVTAETDGGRIAGQMVAVVRHRSSWLPPFIYRHCRVLGEGVFTASDPAVPAGADASGVASDTVAEIFGIMLRALTDRIGSYMLYTEFSNLSSKMAGYRQFRECGYFPVRWMSIHNSLHSHAPEERISANMAKRIALACKRGVVTVEADGDDDFREFSRLLRRHNWTKPKRYIPADEFFRGLHGDHGRLFLTRYRGRVIGCSAVAYSQGQAYLMYAAYRRKTYAWLHPGVHTVWNVIKTSYKRGCSHVVFMDVGLPFQKNAFREFILRFGGKPTSTYRWFFCPVGWVNRLLSWFYRD